MIKLQFLSSGNQSNLTFATCCSFSCIVVMHVGDLKFTLVFWQQTGPKVLPNAESEAWKWIKLTLNMWFLPLVNILYLNGWILPCNVKSFDSIRCHKSAIHLSFPHLLVVKLAASLLWGLGWLKETCKESNTSELAFSELLDIGFAMASSFYLLVPTYKKAATGWEMLHSLGHQVKDPFDDFVSWKTDLCRGEGWLRSFESRKVKDRRGDDKCKSGKSKNRT